MVRSVGGGSEAKSHPQVAEAAGPGEIVTADAASEDAGGMVVRRLHLERLGGGDARKGQKELLAWLKTWDDRENPVLPAAKPKAVRVANIADEPAVMDLLMMDVEDNAAHVAIPDPDRMLQHVHLGTRRQGGIVGVIDGPDKKPVAVCVMVPTQWWWSNQWVMQELVCYVHPDHRRTDMIDDLMDFQKWVVDEWSRVQGSRVYLLNGVLGAWRVVSKMRLYSRKFRMAGAAYIYPPPDMKGR
jgi:hypothetical protein